MPCLSSTAGISHVLPPPSHPLTHPQRQPHCPYLASKIQALHYQPRHSREDWAVSWLKTLHKRTKEHLTKAGIGPASFYQTPTPVPSPLAGTDGEAQAEARGRHQSCCPTTWNMPPVPGSCLYVSLTLREIRCLPLTASSNQGLESQVERKLRGDSDHAYPAPRRARGLWLTISSDPDQLPPQRAPPGSQH